MDFCFFDMTETFDCTVRRKFEQESFFWGGDSMQLDIQMFRP